MNDIAGHNTTALLLADSDAQVPGGIVEQLAARLSKHNLVVTRIPEAASINWATLDHNAKTVFERILGVEDGAPEQLTETANILVQGPFRDFCGYAISAFRNSIAPNIDAGEHSAESIYKKMSKGLRKTLHLDAAAILSTRMASNCLALSRVDQSVGINQEPFLLQIAETIFEAFQEQDVWNNMSHEEQLDAAYGYKPYVTSLVEHVYQEIGTASYALPTAEAPTVN